MAKEEVTALLESEEIKDLKHIKIKGLMGMATFTDDQEILNKEFGQLAELYEDLKETHDLSTLSMGMSADYPLAIKKGSNMIRVGSAIFGARNYN